MILENKKLFFKKGLIIFEDDKIIEAIRDKKYSSFVGITRSNLDVKGVVRGVKNTSVIDLNKTEDDIFSAFSDNTRNEIRRTYKIDSLKIVAEDKNFNDVYNLYKKFEYSQKRVPFKQTNMRDSVIFSAYLDNVLISAIYVDRGGRDLRIRYIFSDRLGTNNPELYKIIGYATRRLVSEICIWGKKNDYVSLDMAAINLTDKDKEGVTKFKMSFGGEILNEYTYLYKTKMFTYFEKLALIKNFFKKLLN